MDRKIQYALIASAAYFVLSYPATYKLTNALTTPINVSTSNSAGCPTLTGLFLHGSVVGLLVYFLMAENYIIPMAKTPAPAYL